MFFSGSLQEGIAFAVQGAKAVVCFVQDDSETSSAWQEENFTGDEFTDLLESRSVLFRIAKDSPEAGFLTSVCPITQYPTVVVIRNGMLQEYIMPNVSKDEFQTRLTAVLDETKPQTQAAAPPADQSTPSPSQGATSPPAQAPEPVMVVPRPTPATAQSPSSQQPQQDVEPSAPIDKGNKPVCGTPSGSSRGAPPQSPQEPQEEHNRPQTINKILEKNIKKDTKEKIPTSGIPKNERPSEQQPNRSTRPPGPPAEYRLQVRLFDGSSIRSAFSPSQTIRKDVRPWLDSEMEEKRPFNLKLILTPHPNRTLTIAEEDQTIQELITGSTATFVMVPIKTYIEAYSDTGSLPVRVVSTAYGLVTSVVSTATGYVGSMLGYFRTRAAPSHTEYAQPQSGETRSSSNEPSRQPRSWGPNIRTLRDHEGDDRSQFYNGNQVRFRYFPGP
ncbi:hypothetical protein BJX99DRAFT_235074 [Aspergillus californicus]